MKQALFLLFIISVTAVSCDRKDIGGDLKNRRDILESENWKLASITDNGGASSLPPCQQDNYYVFVPGGTGRYEEGANNCLDSLGSGNAPTYTDFRWEMTGDLRQLYFLQYGGDPEDRFEWEILDMEFDKLEVRQVRTIDGIDHRIDMVYRPYTP